MNLAVNNTPVVSLDYLRWYWGSITVATGATASSNERKVHAEIHVPKGVECTNDTYEYGIYVYDSNRTYLGVWNGKDYIKNAYWNSGKTSLVTIPQDYLIRIVVRGKESGILPTDTDSTMFAYISDAEYKLDYYNRNIPCWFYQGRRDLDGTIKSNTSYATSFRYVFVGKGNSICFNARRLFNVEILGADEDGGTLTRYYVDQHISEFIATTDYICINLSQTDSTTGELIPIGSSYNTINLQDEFILSYKNSMPGLERFIDYSDSISTITSDEVSSYGIKFTKLTDSTFQLSGRPSTTGRYKVFDVLLGNDSTSTALGNPNLTEPDTYTISFASSDLTVLDVYVRFAISTSDSEGRQYLQSGQSFVIDADLPATLFVYVSTTATFTTPVTITWALYKGKDKAGYPLYSETMTDIVARSVAQQALDSFNNIKVTSIPSWGESNASANVKQIADIVWTPTAATMPKGTSSWDIGVPVKGIPYSSAREVDKMVGPDVSIHTFMTAVHDPRSVLYTRRVTVDNGSTYYGSVCSAFASWVYQVGMNLTSRFLLVWDEFDNIPMQDLRVLDLIAISGHSAMITDIEKDDYGRINYVTVTEEWFPSPRVRRYTWKLFLSVRDGYIARRYKHLNAVTYESIPYVQCFDETSVDIIYPDVQTEFGDKAVFMSGEDVNIHVIEDKGYTSITVQRDDNIVFQTSTIADFTLTDVQPGMYTITAVGTTNSESSFYVVEATCSWDQSTGIVNFRSSNATPTMIGVYDLPEDRNVAIEPHILTKEEILNGSADVSDLLTSTRKYVKVVFRASYGTAVWYCPEDHSTRWIPIT